MNDGSTCTLQQGWNEVVIVGWIIALIKQMTWHALTARVVEQAGMLILLRSLHHVHHRLTVRSIIVNFEVHHRLTWSVKQRHEIPNSWTAHPLSE